VQLRNDEPARERAVAVVVERQPRLDLGPALLGLEQLRLVLVGEVPRDASTIRRAA
jgi:hypothetical protein